MATDKLGGAGMLEYLKHAFVARWNLLLCFGAAAAAVLSPWPDVLLPLIAAGEMLTGLSAYSQQRFIFFFNGTATTEIYTLSLHDASSNLAGGLALVTVLP